MARRAGRAAVTSRGWLVGALALGMLVLGLGLHYPLVAALGGALLLALALEVLAVVAPPDLVVRRTVTPAVVVRHDDCRATLAVTGRRHRGLARLEVSDTVEGALVPVPLPEAARAETVSVPYPIPTGRRGLVEVGPVRLRRVGLAGLADHTVWVGRTDLVRVLPRRVPVSGMPTGTRRSARGAETAWELGGTDLVGLHEYAMGDDLRRLHWATSARTGSLMVREDVDPAEPHVRVVLDDTAAGYRSGRPRAERDDQTFEDAVELAAALCRSAAAEGHPVRFLTTSGRHQVEVPGSPTGQPQHEAHELEWLLAEIELVEAGLPATVETDSADVAVAVSGPGADEPALRRLLDSGSPARTVHAVVDPSATVVSEDHAGLLVLRGEDATALARTWDRVLRP
ncbi:DUF58 domain-containing protein [Nocardioides anomalus]|uniref:DUF58 domain-containing protein n=1 Tax=Nocardioides anomalus TaxID=2712223 RepID=A0A6G6WAV6_9ACTN|nr:DUF58 domain-containing protein [Nocardioides anomalus]QIG42170.1 DUF58 domain-containing protein [Nocardioides anomalus]